MRNIALFSDIHGNVAALEAVMADIAHVGIDERYCLGDLVGYGPQPEAVVEALRASGIPVIQGNYDEGIGNRRGECGCYYATEQARADGEASYAFTDAAVSEESAAWLASLPAQIALTESGARVLLVHGSPRKVNEYLMPDRTEEQLARLADTAEVDVVCHGHVHLAFHRSFATDGGMRIHYVSTGSVGKPKDGDPRACWVELVLGSAEEVLGALSGDAAAGPVGKSETWVGIAVHRVEYDAGSVAADMVAKGLPQTLAD
ncbi:MAG: metallophosphoesterase family protein, partial [Actinomycetota bacterium]|nr:metallophosphoesterase family protein [Actinomycetota bacterium]